MRALQTKHNGVLYRSRTEARWAVFFEQMGWTFVYEPEGYDLDGEWYLPDFWLQEFEMFVEIKAEAPTEAEIAKAEALHKYSRKRVILIAGSPGIETYQIIEWRDGKRAGHGVPVEMFNGDIEVDCCFLSCRRCENSVIACLSEKDMYMSWDELLPPGEKCSRRDCGDRYPVISRRMKAAYEAAQNSRFGVHEA